LPVHSRPNPTSRRGHLAQLADAKQEIEEMSGTERGKLVIGSIPTVAPYFLPTCLATFNRKFPQIRVTVVEEFTTALLDRLEGGVLDLALLALPVAGNNFLLRKFSRERLYLVVPLDHRLAKQSTIHLKQVEKDAFLLLKEGHCFRDNTLSACGRARLDPNVVFESGQFTTILVMVAAGTGFRWCRKWQSSLARDAASSPSPMRGHFAAWASYNSSSIFAAAPIMHFLSTYNNPRRRKLAMKMS
jgi:DNA-binding transcriptional LysR family regulator